MISADTIEIESSLCLNGRIRNRNCTVCIETCPQKALIPKDTTGDEISVDSNCTNCGMCAVKCPAGAIRQVHSVRHLLRSKDGTVDLYCTEMKCDGYVACLAGVDGYELAYLALLARINLCIDEVLCNQCNPSAYAQLKAQIERVNCFLEKISVAPIHLSMRRKEQLEELGRRELFGFFFTRIKQSIAKVLPLTESNADYRALLVQTLQKEIPGALGNAAPLFWGVQVLSECTMCGACMRACRNGALSIILDEKNSKGHLRHDQSSCSGCGACVALCPNRALERSVNYSKLQCICAMLPDIVVARELMNCQTCGRLVTPVTGIAFCLECQRKQRKRLQAIY